MKKILVFGPTRTGSNYIYAAVAKHLIPYYELLSDRFSRSHKMYVNTTPDQKLLLISNAVDYIVQKELAITKCHPNHLFYLEEHNLLDKFKSADFYTIVTLRRDLVQASISHARGVITKEWFEYDTTFTPMALTQEQLLVGLNSTIYSLFEILDNRCKIRYDEVVYYEDITGVPGQDIKKLKIYTPDLFGPEKPAPVYPERSPNKEETLLNYNELEESSLEFFDSWNGKDDRFTIVNGNLKINLKGF